MVQAAGLERRIATLLKYEKICGEKGQTELIKKNEMLEVKMVDKLNEIKKCAEVIVNQ